jgi:hypothetical protein
MKDGNVARCEIKLTTTMLSMLQLILDYYFDKVGTKNV